MTMLPLLLADSRIPLPSGMDVQSFLTKVSLGVIVLGVLLLIFYAAGRMLRGKESLRSGLRSSARGLGQGSSPSSSKHTHHHRHHRRRHHSRREGHRNPTLKEAGGLPPLRSDDPLPPA